jgi:hypothetical protein
VKELAELFPDEDHRFHLGLRRGETAAFFAPTPSHAELIAERRHWLDTQPERHAALLSVGAPLCRGFARLLGEPDSATVGDLGRRWEPDFLLLAPDATGVHRLLGGALCFPTGWALEAQLGRPLAAIHGTVPELNPALAAPIQQFLNRLKPEIGFMRANWGLAATAELNLHPALNRPRLNLPVDLSRIWLRVERQLLAGLQCEGGVLFAIRVECHPLNVVLAEDRVRAGLHRALRTMSEPVAAYKGLAAVREELVRATAG